MEKEFPLYLLLIQEQELKSCLEKYKGNPFQIQTEAESGCLYITAKNAAEQEELFLFLIQHFPSVLIRKEKIAQELYTAYLEKNKTFALAESCTGGLASKIITDIPGSSKIFWGSAIVYSNDAKNKLLQVDLNRIQEKGAVSLETVQAMALGLLRISGADFAASVSGVAGPDGMPIGKVWCACVRSTGDGYALLLNLKGNRNQNRWNSAYAVFLLLETMLNKNNWLDSFSNNTYSVCKAVKI